MKKPSNYKTDCDIPLGFVKILEKDNSGKFNDKKQIVEKAEKIEEKQQEILQPTGIQNREVKLSTSSITLDKSPNFRNICDTTPSA